MAKFTFPFPGRSKKQQTPQPPAEPLTKAQRILGSTQLDKDSSKAWDTASNSGISVTVSESTDPTTDSSGKGAARGRWAGSDWDDDSDVLPQRLRSDEMRLGADDFASDYASALREQTSSSTIRSWYDKTKQPMAVTQQTSASAIAKGPPSKAQRLLDMDNTYAPPVQAPPPEPKSKSKKKPAKLDLSTTKPSGRGKDKEKDWNNPVLGNDYVMRSPSILSPLTPNGGKRPRRKIQKRPTHESLKRQPQEPVASRPNTAGKLESTPAQLSPPPSLPAQTSLSAQPSPAMDELPSLYKHYEQMSFADAMDDEFEMVVKENSHKGVELSHEWHPDVHDAIVPSADYRPQTQETRDSGRPGPLSSHPTIVSHSSHSSYSTQRSHPTHLTHPAQSSIPPSTSLPPVPQAFQPPSVKIEPNSLLDYAASVSSRHTRTSKASRRTDKSFQTADLQEKSVLMLSSDSEEDEEAESYNQMPTSNSSPVAPSTRRPSVTDSRHMSTAESVVSQSTMAEDHQSLQSRDSTLTAKRISSAPVGFLTVPQSRSSIATSTSTSSSMGNLQETIQEEEILPLHPSHSDVSLSTSLSLTNSTTSTAMTWQGREGYGVQEARAVTMQSAEGPGPEPDSEQDWTDSDVEPDRRDTMVRRESSVPAPVNAAEPTPPLSPTTMEHFIQSPESLEGVHDHFMGLTRQEQMLIQALRQRREVMRKSSLTPSEEEFAQHQHQPVSSQEHLKEPLRKGHQSNPSEATITEATFNFDFPAPPTNKELLPLDSPRLVGPSMPPSLTDPTSPSSQEPATNDVYTTDEAVFVLSAPPSSHHKASKSILRNPSVREQPQPKPKTGLSGRRGHIPPPLNHAVSAPSNTSQRLPEPNPVIFDTPPPPRPNPGEPSARDSLLIPRSNGSVRRHRSTLEKSTGRSTRDRTSTRRYHDQNWPIMEDETEAAPISPRRQRRREDPNEGPGIPRPDSPISPMTDAFPMVPSRRNTYQSQQARLSAFGPPAGAEAMGLSWLGGAE